MLFVCVAIFRPSLYLKGWREWEENGKIRLMNEVGVYLLCDVSAMVPFLEKILVVKLLGNPSLTAYPFLTDYSQLTAHPYSTTYRYSVAYLHLTG